MNIKTKVILPVILAIGVTTMSGCGFIKPYDKPSFVEIKPNQTAFVIPLTGATSDQGKFQSEELLKKMQVASKRIQIPHQWIKTGRLTGTGHYLDTVKVIVVDRYPETREWTNDTSTGTTAKAQGFIGESRDSIKFEIGISATAQIQEEDTAKFLYRYSGKSLSQVMDFEIRNRIGTVLIEKYGSLSMAQVRESKDSVIQYVREQVEPYFKDRGITLSNIGYVGDLKYIDPKVQDAINEAFNAKQQQDAQAIKNQTEIAKAQAEATANTTRKKSMNEIAEMKKLDLQADWIKKWDGKLPVTTTGENAGIMMNLGK
jgi:hypothetical protein